MTNATVADKTFYQQYYGQLVGGTITEVNMKAGEYDQLWPNIRVEMPNGDIFNLEVSQDEEGNGPGFLFGLPHHPE